MKMKDLFKRTKYLAYYFKKMDWPRFRKFLKYAKQQTGWSGFRLFMDSVKCVYRYNIGWIDYFIFRFFEKDASERDKWVGTGYKYESDLLMNPKSTRHLLENKIHFYEAYGPFVLHETCTIDDFRQDNSKAQKVLSNTTGKIVVKDALGQCGWDVEILNARDYDRDSLIRYMKSKGFNLAEEYIIQHPDIARLSNSGVNTLRIISQLNKDNDVEILGARLRISVNNHVDNLASGNIAAPVDLKTGKVNGLGIYSDITKSSVTEHPVSGITLAGFQVPMWDACLNMVKKAALHRPENRSIGWDVVLTDKGPELLEGNHNWCKILWQLPINQGLKSVLKKHVTELPEAKTKVAVS
jgi:hypothetical protein